MTALTDIKRGAVLSHEDPPIYRYRLDRSWDLTRPVMIWIMLNPSTADHERDDLTIHACMDFARRNGCGGITVVNLFAFRSASPRTMYAAKDPVGRKNDAFLRKVLVDDAGEGDIVVAGWGAHGERPDRESEERRLIQDWGVKLRCFGRTKDGHPKHPQARGAHRIPRDAPLLPYGMEA